MTRALVDRLPGPLAIHLAAVAAVVTTVTVAHGLIDTDLWWHLATGELIAESGRIPAVDPFSFTWAGRPWTTHEWLSELLIYAVLDRLGETVTLVLFGIIAAGALAAVAWALARNGVRTLPIAAATAIGAWVLFSYATVRPQAISWLLTGVVLAVLLFATPERRRVLLALPPLFVVWANLHGLYVAGLGLLAVYLIFTLLGRTPMRDARGWVAAIAAASLLATMVTPAGPAGLLYPLRYVEPNDWGLRHISEWQSPNFHEASQLALLVLIMGTVAVGARSVPAWLATLALGGVAMALLATRNAPLTAVLALPAIAIGLDGVLPRRPAAHRPPRERLARRGMEALVAALVVVAAAVIVPRLPAATGIFERSFPVAAVDRLAEVDPDASVLAEYGWGGYAIYRLHERGGRVFVDGRNDMYDQAILEDYTAIRNADADWSELLERYRVEAVLLPPATPLVRGPLQAAGWCEVHADAIAVLLTPSCPTGGYPGASAERWLAGRPR